MRYKEAELSEELGIRGGGVERALMIPCGRRELYVDLGVLRAV